MVSFGNNSIVSTGASQSNLNEFFNVAFPGIQGVHPLWFHDPNDPTVGKSYQQQFMDILRNYYMEETGGVQDISGLGWTSYVWPLADNGGTVTKDALPEPASLALLTVGLAGMGVVRRRKAQ